MEDRPIQTPNTARKELWELLDMPAVTEDFGKAFSTLVEAAKTSGRLKEGMQASREQDDMMLSMISTCLQSIAENTNFVMRARQDVETTKIELGEMKSSLADLQSKLESVSHENAVLRAAAAGDPLPPAPAPAPAPVPAVGPEFLKRLEYIEWIQHQHSDQLTQVLEHIMSDIASEEVVNSHFSHPSVEKSLTDAQQAELDSMVMQTTAVSTVSLDKSLVETAFTGQNFVKLCFDGWRLQVGRKSKKDSSEDEQAEAADAAIEVRLPAQEQHISEETAATIAEHCQDKVSRKMREHLEFEELKNEVKKLQSSLNGLREQAEAAMSAAASAQQLAENTGKPAVATTGGLSPEQAQQIEEQAAAVEVKLQQHEEKIYATAEELKAVVAEADRARQVEETHAEDITWLKKELSDVRTELKPVGNDARAAAAGVTALNSKVESMSVQNDKLQVRVEKTADAVFTVPDGLEPRVGQLELALRRLAGAVDIKEEMDNQAKELAALLASKADQNALDANAQRLNSLRPELEAQLAARAAEMVEMLQAAKGEWQAGSAKISKEVEGKADRDWLKKLEAQIRAEVEKTAAGSIDEATLEARLDALRKAMEEAMANAAKAEQQNSSAAFRCIACDHPLPAPHEAKRQRKHFNLYQTLPHVDSLSGTDAVHNGPVASSPGSVSFAANRTAPNLPPDVVYRGGFPTVVNRQPPSLPADAGGSVVYVSGLTRPAPAAYGHQRRAGPRDPRHGGNASPILPPLDKSLSPVPSAALGTGKAGTDSSVSSQGRQNVKSPASDAIAKVVRGPLTLGNTSFGDVSIPPAAIPAYEPWGGLNRATS